MQPPAVAAPPGSSPDVVATLRAAAAGDPGALCQQGLWQLAGSVLPRDLPGARASLGAAAGGGNIEAALIDVALTANGSGGPADWRAARTSLELLAPVDRNAHRLSSLLNDMAVNDTGMPLTRPATEALTPGGSVVRVRACLTPAECAHVADSVADLLRPAVVVDPRTGRQVPHPIRTSDSAVVSPLREDLVIRAINLRVAAISDTEVDQGEALTVLRYAPGQQFRQHSDVLPGVRNQRVKTVLLYLNDGYDGGETVFPAFGLTISPAIGDAIVFTNTLPDGRPDPAMAHAGLPVRRGVKWLATRWIRARPFDVWRGPESV